MIRKIFKKRTILALLLTVVFMMALKGFYIEDKGIELSFDIKSSKALNIQFFYTKTKEDKFNEKDSIRQKVEASSTFKHIKVKLPIESIFLFRMDFDSNPNDVSVKNVQINDTRLDLAQLSCINQIDKHSLKDATLSLSSTQRDPYITFKQSLESVECQKIVHYEFFIILLFVVFLINYKLVQYLVSFKLDGNNSRLDIIFLLIFFVAIFVPMMHLSDAKISTKENRTLAKYLPFLDGKSVNLNFGSDFESFFNDRFFGRDFLMKFNNSINKRFSFASQVGGNERVLIERDNWLFYKGDKSLDNYKNITLFNEIELEKAAIYLNSINDYALKNNKKFYLFIAPDKNKIYPEKITSIKQVYPDSKSRANQLIKYLRENTNINVIYPYEELYAEKEKGLLYYKNDTHWNNHGAYVGYKVLMNEIKKDFPNLKILDIKEYKEESKSKGDLTTMYDIIGIDNESTYLVPVLPLNPSLKIEEKKEGHKAVWVLAKSDSENDLSVVLFRDSFTNALLPYINNSFKMAEYFRGIGGFSDQYQVTLEKLKNNPDIIVIEIVERYLNHLSNRIPLKELN